jgi:hypothetical protein
MDGSDRRRRRKGCLSWSIPRSQPPSDSLAQLRHGVGGRGRARVVEERGLFTRVRQGARAGAAGRLWWGWWRHAAHVPSVPLLVRARLR